MASRIKLNKSTCALPVSPGCDCVEEQNATSITFQVAVGRPYYFSAWNLGTKTLVVERWVTCPDDWKPHKRCSAALELTDADSDTVFYIPGWYRLSLKSLEDFPDDFGFEKILITPEIANLWIQERCCCEK